MVGVVMHDQVMPVVKPAMEGQLTSKLAKLAAFSRSVGGRASLTRFLKKSSKNR
jgi:hypothetical protein